MKTLFLTAAFTACLGLFSNNGFAQNEKRQTQKKEEIIIKKNDNSPSKMIIEVDSNQITINGKPVSDFNGDVIVLKRNFLGGDNNSLFSAGPDVNIFKSSNKAFLGVLTAKGDKGAIIKNVINESSAKKAGLEEGDIITKFGSKDITSPGDLRDAVSAYEPGNEVSVTYLRSGNEKITQIKLGKAPNNGPVTYNMDSLRNSMNRFNNGRGGYGFGMPRLPEDHYNFFNRQPHLGLKIEDTKDNQGAKVLEVQKDSPAEKAGIKAGDVITEMNGQKINNVDEVKSHLQQSDNKVDYKMKARRGDAEIDFDVHISKILKSVNV